MNFLSNITLIIEKTNIIMFEYKGHRIVSFEGGRMLIHGTTKTLDAIHLINQLFG